MRIAPILILSLLWTGTPLQAEPQAILRLAPTPAELGPGWTTNVVAYLIDPLSEPPEIDYRGDPKTSLPLVYQRSQMDTNHRTGCGLLLYGRGDLVHNSGLYRVHIQRWQDRRALHNAWVGWKMNPLRVVPKLDAPGEDYFWTEEWWRRTLVEQNLVFRRGLFHLVIEGGPDSDRVQMIRLARVFDAKIRGKPVPP